MRSVMIPVPIFLEILRGNVDPMLANIIADVVNLWPEATIRFTDLNRTEAENKAAGAKSRIHVVGPPWRAVDIGGRYLSQEDLEAIADKLNAIYVYDPRRPKKPCAYAKPHGKGKHVHAQCHPHTRRRDGS